MEVAGICVHGSPKPPLSQPHSASPQPSLLQHKRSVLSPMYRGCRGNETYATESPVGLNTKHSPSSPCPEKAPRSHSQSTNSNGCRHTEATRRRQRVCRILVPAARAVLLLTTAPRRTKLRPRAEDQSHGQTRYDSGGARRSAVASPCGRSHSAPPNRCCNHPIL